MENIRLGSLCLTLVDKTFDSADGEEFIPKGTYVTVCDDDNIDKGYVLVESEGYSIVYDYLLKELMLVKNYM